MKKIHSRRTVIAALTLAVLALQPVCTFAQAKKFKIGLVVPMTGPFASTGRQVEFGVRTYIAEHGDQVAGQQIEVIVKDDTGMAANTKRLAQELVVNEKVNVLAGFGLTPLALATAPIATQTKTPMLVMAAQTLSIMDASPYIIRSSGTIPQVTSGMADWATQQGIKKVVTLVPDYAPGHESEAVFKDIFAKGGGQIVGEVRVPLRDPDFAPFLQKARDLKPDALYVMLPSGPGNALLKQYNERGMEKAGIRLIAHGAIADDDNLNEAGEAALGLVTSDYYSAAHPSDLNKKFVAEYSKVSRGVRPNFFGVAGYDGMHLLYEAIKATKGSGDGDALLAAMKGQTFESPRGPVTLDPKTRDFVQNIYLRKATKVDGQIFNVEFATVKNVPNTGIKR